MHAVYMPELCVYLIMNSIYFNNLKIKNKINIII